jgi:hypothetical protein
LYFKAKSGNWCNYSSLDRLVVFSPETDKWAVRAGGTGSDNDRISEWFDTEQEAIDYAAKLARAVGVVE